MHRISWEGFVLYARHPVSQGVGKRCLRYPSVTSRALMSATHITEGIGACTWKSCEHSLYSHRYLDVIWSSHKFAHVTTAELSCHVQNCDRIGSLYFIWEQVVFDYELINSMWSCSLTFMLVDIILWKKGNTRSRAYLVTFLVNNQQHNLPRLNTLRPPFHRRYFLIACILMNIAVFWFIFHWSSHCCVPP